MIMRRKMNLAGLVWGGGGLLSLVLAGSAQAVTAVARFDYRVPVPAEHSASAPLPAPLLSVWRLHPHGGLDVQTLPFTIYPYVTVLASAADITARPVVPNTPLATVPDGGSTGAMLGAAMCGLVWWRLRPKRS